MLEKPSARLYQHFALGLGYASLIAFSQIALPYLWPESTTPYILLRIISLIHLFLIIALAGAIGQASLDRLSKGEWSHSPLLFKIIQVALGLGLLASAISLLGFVQIFSPLTIQGLVLFLCLIFGRQGYRFVKATWDAMGAGLRALPQSSPLIKLFSIFSLVLLMLTFVNTLTPPWDYDGLMYHLLGPSEALHAGGFTPDLENWYTNGPFSIEMLFSIGLSLGDDVLPKLLHFTFWILLAVLTYSLGARWFSRQTGFLAMVLILGVPALPIWAGFAYIDIGWSLFELLGLASIIIWSEQPRVEWLMLAGVFTGLAMSSKYLGLIGALIVGTIFIGHHLVQKRWPGWKDCFTLALPAFVISFPWYLKNLLWFGNPVYPLIWGGPAWDHTRLALYNAYLESFGVGGGLSDLLRLPWNVYAHNERFGAVFNRNDIPHPLFLLAPLALFLRDDRKIRILSIVSGVRIGIWFLGSQQLRFLLPIYPIFAILSAVSITELSRRYLMRPSLTLVLPTLSVGLMFIPIFYQIQILRQYRSSAVLTGQISRETFLESAVGDYAAARFIHDSLPASARVIMLGNGRGYYCVPKCLPDPDHFNRARQIRDLQPGVGLHEWLRDQGGTHLQISIEDLDFLLQHDSQSVMLEAYDRLAVISEDTCFSAVYEDRWIKIFSLDC